MTAESHRVTSFEIFFDLVFVFAITRVGSFMARSLTAVTLARGLILLLLLWWSWTAYVWLGNRVRTDQGLVRSGMLVVMAALFIAALVMPDAWSRHTGTVDAPLIVAAAFIVVRLIYFGLHLTAAAEDSRLRTQLLADAIPQTFSLAPLIAGAVLAGGAWQTALWAAAFVIDFGGGWIASRVGGWQVRSPGHFAERHRMVLIIVLGESLISVGTGAGDSVTRTMVLVAAALGFAAVVCLWRLYFEHLAAAAQDALEHASPGAPSPDRPRRLHDGPLPADRRRPLPGARRPRSARGRDRQQRIEPRRPAELARADRPVRRDRRIPGGPRGLHQVDRPAGAARAIDRRRSATDPAPRKPTPISAGSTRRRQRDAHRTDRIRGEDSGRRAGRRP
jgi:hypothetical protein